MVGHRRALLSLAFLIVMVAGPRIEPASAQPATKGPSKPSVFNPVPPINEALNEANRKAQRDRPVPTAGPHRFTSEIKKFVEADAMQSPPQNALLFVGSSSIRLWNVPEWFPGRAVINRGFGGAMIADVRYYFDKVILPYKPRQIIMYAGENDLAEGRTPEQVAADYRAIIDRIHQEMPNTPVLYITLKPSPKRWALVSQIREANRLIAEISRNRPDVTVIDVFTPMLGADGQPRPELFVEDRLHLNRAGYDLWKELLTPHLVPVEEVK